MYCLRGKMIIPLFLKKIYYNLPIPYFISSRISGRLYTKKFNDELKQLKY